MARRKRDLRVGVLLILVQVLSMLFVLLLVWWVADRPEGSATAMGGVDAPCVAITFDDGPRRETTTLLLDGLVQRGVHATFFLVGTRVDGKEDLIARMYAEGHQIGIHSQNHRALDTLNAAALEEEVTALENTLRRLVGEQDYMLRPPYGYTSAGLERWAAQPIILWSVDPEDWSDHDVERQVASVVGHVQDGDIILLHDIYYASVETALQIVDALLEEGYRFVTVEELFAIRGVEPEAGCIYRSLPPKN